MSLVPSLDDSPGIDTTMSRSRINSALGLGEDHAAWLATLEQVDPVFLSAPVPESIESLVVQLGLQAEDASDVLRAMPTPDRDPEYWWLLERSHSLLVRSLANRNTSHVWKQPPPLPASLNLFSVFLIVLSTESIRRQHKTIGVPHDMSWETLSLLGRAMSAYRRTHREPGVHLSAWDWLRFSGWLYQVGRLEVTPYWLLTHPEAAGPLFWYDDDATKAMPSGFQKGSAAIGLHVPANVPLGVDACDQSLHRIRNAFDTLQPDGPPRIATCTSWLLDDQLTEYLRDDSNILSFQRRFTMVPGARDDDDWILGAVFGRERPKELAALPQNTTLAQAVVAHLQKGRHWRMRTGWLQLR
jgi:hypothetical protein